MISASSPTSSDDFIMVESQQTRDLPFRNRIQTTVDYPEECSDDDLEKVSSPGSVRSLPSTPSSPATPFTQALLDQNSYSEKPSAGAVHGYTIDEAARSPGSVLRTAIQPCLSTEKDPRVISSESSTFGATKSLATIANEYPVSSKAPSLLERIPHKSDTGQYILDMADASKKASDTVPPSTASMITTGSLPKTKRKCHDHLTMDQHIVDSLIEHALNAQIAKEHGFEESKILILRQRMMSRLLSLDPDHVVAREATKNIKSARSLFHFQHRNTSERRHIYTYVFRDVERAALYYLYDVHRHHFSVDCSFADLDVVVGLEFLNNIDPLSRTDGYRLASKLQITCRSNLCDMNDKLPSGRSLFSVPALRASTGRPLTDASKFAHANITDEESLRMLSDAEACSLHTSPYDAEQSLL